MKNKMKKLLLILITILTFSCTAEQPEILNCNCGIIETKVQPSPQIENYIYSYNCNGQKVSIISQLNYQVGEEICK